MELPAGTAAIRELSVKLGSYENIEVTRTVVLKIEFDDKETVYVVSKGARADANPPISHELMRPHMHINRGMVEAISKIFPMLVAANLARSESDWIHKTNRGGETILHRHARAGYPKVCRKLIELGADVNAVDARGRTALSHAFDGCDALQSKPGKQRYIETCVILLDNGTDLNQVGTHAYHNYLRHAAAKDLYEIFDVLLSKGADKDLKQNAGNLLCFAARHGNQDRVRQLLEWGADINAQGHEKSTALHQAARVKDLEMCKLLISHGADVNARDDRGQTPLFEVFDRWDVHQGRYTAKQKQAVEAAKRKAIADGKKGVALRTILDAAADLTEEQQKQLAELRREIGHLTREHRERLNDVPKDTWNN